MKLMVNLFLIGVSVGALKFSDYKREIPLSDARFVQPDPVIDNSWNDFTYVLCSYTEGKSQDVNCTLFIENPISNNEAKIKFCEFRYSREEELKHGRRIDGFNPSITHLSYLDKNTLMLHMQMNVTYFNQSSNAVYSIINKETCKTVNRYYIPQNDMEVLYVSPGHESVKEDRYESKMCGSLRNCTITVDFDGNEQSLVYNPEIIHRSIHEKTETNEVPDHEIFNVKRFLQWISASQDMYTICRERVDDSANINMTVYSCNRHDNNDTLSFYTMLEVAKNSVLMNVYNLRNGGLLAVTANCEQDYYYENSCHSFDIHKINKAGLYEGHAAVTGMKPWPKMKFLSTDDEFCMFAMYAPKVYDQKRKDHATLRTNCIKNDPFFKF